MVSWPTKPSERKNDYGDRCQIIAPDTIVVTGQLMAELDDPSGSTGGSTFGVGAVGKAVSNERDGNVAPADVACRANPETCELVGREIFVLAKVDKRMVNAYFFFNPQARRNLYANLRTILGGSFSDAEIKQILSDILAEAATTRADLEAFNGVQAGKNGKVTLTHGQKAILDRFARGLPSTTLNQRAVQMYLQGLRSGRIIVR